MGGLSLSIGDVGTGARGGLAACGHVHPAVVCSRVATVARRSAFFATIAGWATQIAVATPLERPSMSSGFHVHGPHDHEVEHAIEHGARGMTGQLAVITAVLATVGALFSYMGGATQADAALAKNDAAIRKTEASDQWNFYQAKNARQAIAEVALDIVPAERRETYTRNIEKYKADKEPIKAKAEALEAEAKDFDDKSEHLMHQHHRWAEATTAIQVAIALAAIALLTRRRWLEWCTLGVAGVGIAIGVAAFLKV
jgi:hypothetical protein